MLSISAIGQKLSFVAGRVTSVDYAGVEQFIEGLYCDACGRGFVTEDFDGQQSQAPPRRRRVRE